MKRYLRLLLWLTFWALSACREHELQLSALGAPPDWNQLEAYQETITQDEFGFLLKHVYSADASYLSYFQITPQEVRIKKYSRGSDEVFRLRFAASRAQKIPAPRYKSPVSLSPFFVDKPLSGLKIALDPGHIGGDWAQVEARWFRVGTSAPVAEGDMTLQVARRLSQRLADLGAEVFLVRETSQPVTSHRPQDFVGLAKKAFRSGKTLSFGQAPFPEGLDEGEIVRQESELLFYRVSEIRARSHKINEEIKPDFTICLHFNAENWGDPRHPALVDANHMHALVNGAYTSDEMALDDVRFEMMRKLLSSSYEVEKTLAEDILAAFKRRTDMPPCHYPGAYVKRVNSNPYLWARNLMANRIYRGPVVYLEPYVMNQREVFIRVQAGDYEGERWVAGRMRPSLYREYAEAVTEGILVYARRSMHSGLLQRPVPTTWLGRVAMAGKF